MRSAIIGGVAVACLLGLSACGNNNKAESPAADRAETASTAPATLDAPKPGLWRVSTAMEGMPGGASVPAQDVCIKDAKLEAPASA